MMPDNVLSDRPAPAQIIGARANPDITARFDQEDGGIALQDPSQGLMYQVWTAEARDGGVWLSAPNFPAQMIRSGNITECSIAFDRAMNWVLAFVEDGQSKLSYYSNLDDDRIEITLNGTNPRVIHDDKREGQSDVGEVLVTYVRDETLYQLRQRDRYGVEFHIGGTGVRALVKVGMGSNLRLQFVVLTPDQPGPVPVDKTALNDALNNAAALDEAGYTPNSWQRVEDAVANGEAVEGNPDATQEEVDQAAAEINAAIEALVPRADTEALQGALEDADELTPSDYTPESWQDLADAVAAGEAIAADPNATQAQVDAAAQAISDAIAALVPVPGICTIGVSGDQAPLFGQSPAQVNGRRVFIDEAPSEITIFSATSDLANPQPMLPGEQVSELSFEWSENDGTVSPGLSLASADFSRIIVGSWGRSNDFVIFAQDVAGNIIPGTHLFIPNIQGTTTLALSVTGATGKVEAYIDGQPQGLSTLNSFYADAFAGATGLHTGVVLETLPTVTVPFGVTLSVAAETMVSQYPAGLIDRCGNELPEPLPEKTFTFLGWIGHDGDPVPDNPGPFVLNNPDELTRWYNEFVPTAPDISAVTPPAGPVNASEMLDWINSLVGAVVDHMTDGQVFGFAHPQDPTGKQLVMEYRAAPAFWDEFSDFSDPIEFVTLSQAGYAAVELRHGLRTDETVGEWYGEFINDTRIGDAVGFGFGTLIFQVDEAAPSAG